MPSRLALALLATILLPACSGIRSPADGPSDDALKSVVRVSILVDGEPRQLGSGTIVDARGDVLTAFHVVGWPAVDSVRAGKEVPRFELELSTSSRERPKARYQAHLAEVDQALDLALLRIDADAIGKPIAKAFPFLRMAGAGARALGSGVVAIGFPGSFDTVQAAGGSISGFSSNLADHISWLRTDAQLLPGMSGGALIDRDGVLIGVPLQVYQLDPEPFMPTGFVRPVERVPHDWLESKHEISGRELLAHFQLTADRPLDETFVGDPSLNRLQEKRLVFTPPRQGGVVRVSPSALIEVVDGNAVVRTGDGEIEILPDEEPDMWLEIAVPLTGNAPLHLRATFEPGAHARDALATTVLQVTIGKKPDRTANGHIVLAPAMLEASAVEDWAYGWMAGRVTEGELAAHDVFASTYDGSSPVLIPGCIRGRRYRLMVVPEKGVAYYTTVLIDSISQSMSASW